MPVQRYLDAIISTGSNEFKDGISVMIPLADDSPDTPQVLHDPLPGLPGTWHRESRSSQQPAYYVRVDPEPTR